MSEEKIQIGIYRINIDTNLFSNEEDNYELFNDFILRKGFTNKNIDTSHTGIENFQVKLFYKNTSSTPKWKQFLIGISDVDESDLLKQRNRSSSESFLILIKPNVTDNIYAVTGGIQSYFAIQEYIDENFGVDIISRLIDRDSKILKSVKELSVVGGVLGTTKQFRNNYNLSENEGFGKIYQELKANLSTNTLITHFGFTADDIRRESVCVAKSSFKINKSITFSQALAIITGCEYVMENEEPIVVNSVEKLNKKNNEELINILEEKLYEDLWLRYSNTDLYKDFDLCHLDFENYLTADSYRLKRNSSQRDLYIWDYLLKDIDDVFEYLRSNLEIENVEQLKSEIESLKIFTYDENGVELTKGNVIRHIFGDVKLQDGRKFFFINNNWYKIDESFIEKLDEGCRTFINSNYYNGLSEVWNYPDTSENDYNSTYIGNHNTIILDKITPQNIELCDILKWDEESIYLIHVKAGFNNMMRDLSSQIFIAANRLLHDINTDHAFVEEVYNHLQNKIGSNDTYFDMIGNQTNSITLNDFKGLFRKNIIFVLAVLDTAQNERELREINTFNSNIAKFSLQDLIQGMKGIDVTLKITQISKG